MIKLTRQEKREIVELYNNDFYDDMIQQHYLMKHKDYFDEIFEMTCKEYGITRGQYENEELDIDYGDFSLDFMYNLLEYSNVDLERDY